MTRSLLSDAFSHHIWATLRLIDACESLEPARLATAVPGTYGSILDTARHLVGADAWYLLYLDGEPIHQIDEDQMDLAELRGVMMSNSGCWERILAEDPDPDTVIREADEDDGYEKEATIGIRLAQALHHGTDHRSQICTALTVIGVEPPSIDVWDFGVHVGRVIEGRPPGPTG